jgi:subtilisin family serine protease
MDPVDVVRLTPMMRRTHGSSDVVVGLIDGPVAVSHPGLAGSDLREIPGAMGASCATASSIACTHGTYVAGLLAAHRESGAAAICPGCPVLVRPIFQETGKGDGVMPSATPLELARAIVQTVGAGARVLNVSAALVQSSTGQERELQAALDHAAAQGVVVVAAAGNQGTVGSNTITRHPWVIPVVACNQHGRPLDHANLGSSIGRRGLSAPGEDVPSLGSSGPPLTLTGSSAAAPFVTGAVALLWSEFPHARAYEVRMAVLGQSWTARRTIVPRLLDAEAAYQGLVARHRTTLAVRS